ncbi:MAG: hypothetical protein Q9M92_05740 [Enterobacterales bacterium]|nr:hypothetical protein [Enterobacterales bacterium]
MTEKSMNEDFLDEESMFEPYAAIFGVGDSLILKVGDELIGIHNRWMELIEEEGIPVSWCPPLETLEKINDNIFLVERVIFFHGGVPLYVLSYGEKREYKILLCETLLTKTH